MSDTDTDRFSELPDEVIHHIYSFIDMKEVLGMTLLSKRYRCLWHSLTYLNFHANMWSSEDKEFERNFKFEKFVDQILLCRDGSNILKLSLSYCWSRALVKKLCRWIDLAVKQHVQELHLEDVYLLPMSFAGPIKTLILKDCIYHKTFTISSPQLKYLKVENSRPDVPWRTFKLRTPSLTTLQLNGYMFDEYSMDDISALVTAEIDVHMADLYSKNREVVSSCFRDILVGFRNVERLILPTHCLKFFPELSDGLVLWPISFCNVLHLKLTEWRRRSYIQEIKKLAGSFPNLETLVLERVETIGDQEKKGEDIGAHISFGSMFCHLKAFEIRKFDGCENERKFLEFLIYNAMVLERITMKVTKTMPQEKVKELVDLCKQLQVTMKASSSVTIKLIMKIEGISTIIFDDSSPCLQMPAFQIFLEDGRK